VLPVVCLKAVARREPFGFRTTEAAVCPAQMAESMIGVTQRPDTEDPSAFRVQGARFYLYEDKAGEAGGGSRG
jgi:hypothetical protein